MPLVSVLVPVRNAAPWLRSSFASLWRQSVADLEVIAVDDGSSDGSGEWLEREAAREPRLRVVRQPPRGLPAALNTALERASAPLVARHDADDVSHRERFALQLAHLRAHPEIGVVGTRVRLFPAHGYGQGMRRWAAWHNALLDHDSMRREVFIDSPLAHGTAVLRRDALAASGGWQEHGWAEDLDLWMRLLERGVRLAKLPRALYGWRQHARSSTRVDARYTQANFVALKIAALDRTLLAGGRRVALVGTGASLERWRAALGPRAARVLARRGPGDGPLESALPHLLVYVSHAARERWRAHLTGAQWIEGRDFIFTS
jgi:glycosyltransferase involved in cell wall biosynthesis